ncbi:hypothetical protein LPJ58_006219, partial [Coemansia sp. RSA 1591]
QPRVIPESRRADGTVRKARRVREGFVPLEEQPKYTTPAERRKQQLSPPKAANNDAVGQL